MASPSLIKKTVTFQKQNTVFEGDVADYDSTYKLVMKVLNFLGFRIMVNDTRFRSVCWSIYIWFEIANVVAAATVEIIKILETSSSGTFLELFTMIPCVGYLIVALAKASKIKWYKHIFENLINELREMWPNGQITVEEHQILTGGLTRLKFLVGVYFSCNMTLGTIYIVPAIISLIRRAAGYDAPLQLPFFYWLPFDPLTEENYAFQIVLMFQTTHCFLAVLFMLCGDLLFFIFMSHITMQFDLLSLRIKKLIHVPLDDQLIEEYPLGLYSKMYEEKDHSAEVETQIVIYQKLATIARRHQALIRLSTDVENMYTFSLLVNFLNSSILICFCLFCVAVVEKWNDFTYKIFFITGILQIWILCWYGQRLLDTSAGVGDALYNSGWYVTSPRVKKSMLIMLHRSQIYVHVTTYGFSIVSLESYAKILKTSWSYFTIMINMYKG